jgi:pimeloyl-ACP methyl ester carboxylesterase
MTHGYPGSVAEFMKIIEPLTNPQAHGGDAVDAFHVVAPSLPGFGFSTPVQDGGWEVMRTAHAWKELMRRLGYERYGAQGGDIGAGVSGELAKIDADHIVGVHLNTDVDAAAAFANPDYLNLDDEEKAALEARQKAVKDGWGYIQIQSTRPQTLAYALTDSPAGQLAWIVEKFREWTDPRAELPEDAVDLDQLLTNISLYWFTQSGASAAHFIYEAFHAPQDWTQRSTVPTGFAAFGGEKLTRRLMDPQNQIAHWSDYDRGRHFAAMEAPDLLVADIQKFFRSLRAAQ